MASSIRVHTRVLRAIPMIALLLAGTAFAQAPGGEGAKEGPAGEDPAGMSEEMQAEMMAAWLKLGAPGPHHERLKLLEGWWDVEAISTMQPGQEAVSHTRAEFEIIHGGRFVLQEMAGQMMGMPFEGFGIDGYDNLAQKHISLWTDNMTSSFMMFEGACTDSCKSVEMICHYTDPMQNERSMRTTLVWQDDDHFTMEMFEQAASPEEEQMMGGKEARTLTLKYSRSAKSDDDDEDGEDGEEGKDDGEGGDEDH